MNPQQIEVSRRQLLSISAASAISAVCGPSLVRAAEPIADRKQSKFKFSLAAYSYRKLLSASGDGEPEMDLLDFIAECAAMQLDGTELTGYYMPDEPTPEYLIGLRAAAFRQGLAISGTAIRNDFGHLPGEQREREFDHVRRWIDYAAILHAPMIRIFAGHQKKGVSEEQTHTLMVEGIGQACQHAADRGIYLALENHGGPTASADGLLKIVRDVDSPWLGVNLDTGNFHTGGDPYAQMQAAAPYAVNVQVKVVVKDESGKAQPMDFVRLKKILTEANYRGFVVLEYEEDGDIQKECRHFVQEMRSALA